MKIINIKIMLNIKILSNYLVINSIRDQKQTLKEVKKSNQHVFYKKNMLQTKMTDYFFNVQ